MKTREPKILHPMESFGSVTGLTEGIRINRLEHRLKPLVPFPHKHDFYQMIFVERGRGRHQIDFDRYPVSPGSCFVMQPAEVHSWTLSAQTKGYVVEFGSETFQSKDLRWQELKRILDRLPSAPQVSQKRFKNLIAICKEADKEFRARKDRFEFLLLAFVTQIIILLGRDHPQKKGTEETNSPLYDTFLHRLELHFREHHRVSFYAEALGLTAKALTMRFHRLGLGAPRDLIQDRCLIEAKRLLVYSNLSIQEIADHLGFEDPNYFARFFRTQTKMSPGAFRDETGRLC